MSDITLEKLDAIIERTSASYAEAKQALEACDGNVVDAIIYIESSKKQSDGNAYTTKDEFLNWIKELVRKGNVTRIRIKRDDKVIVDIPVNAGIAVTGITYAISGPLLALGILTAFVVNVTIEITKEDGSVEVINKLIKNTVSDVKDRFDDMTEDIKFKDKVNGFAEEMKDKFSNITKDKFSNITDEVKQKVSEVTDDVREKFSNKQNKDEFEGSVYKYTVKFEEVNDEDIKSQGAEEQKK